MDRSAGRAGIKSFVVPAGTPGMTLVGLEKKLGIRASDTATLRFENCRIPKENLLGSAEVKKRDPKPGGDPRGDLPGILRRSDERPRHDQRKLATVPREHGKTYSSMRPASDCGKDLGRADRLRQALDLPAHIHRCDGIRDVERGDDIGVGDDLVRLARVAEERGAQGKHRKRH